LPTKLSGKKLYSPQENAKETDIERRLQKLWGEKYK